MASGEAATRVFGVASGAESAAPVCFLRRFLLLGGRRGRGEVVPDPGEHGVAPRVAPAPAREAVQEKEVVERREGAAGPGSGGGGERGGGRRKRRCLCCRRRRQRRRRRRRRQKGRGRERRPSARAPEEQDIVWRYPEGGGGSMRPSLGRRDRAQDSEQQQPFAAVARQRCRRRQGRGRRRARGGPQYVPEGPRGPLPKQPPAPRGRELDGGEQRAGSGGKWGRLLRSTSRERRRPLSGGNAGEGRQRRPCRFRLLPPLRPRGGGARRRHQDQQIEVRAHLPRGS